MTFQRSIPAYGEAHVWYGDTEALLDPTRADACRRLLSDEERIREMQFRFDADRRQFVFAHALLRVVLSESLGCSSDAIVFGSNPYGKPTLAYPEATGLCFNLSHTSGLAACAIARGSEVGVDVEKSDRSVDELALARRYFSKSEVELLESAPTAGRRSMFYRLWTLKEAYVKACGLGLSLPLADFAFAIPSGEPPTISFTRPIEATPSDWHFSRVEIPGHYQASLALHMREPARFVCHWHEMHPHRLSATSEQDSLTFGC